MKACPIAAMLAGVAGSLCSLSPAIAQQRGMAEVSLNRGVDAFMSSDYDTARQHFEAALAADPEFAAGHYFLGLTLLQQATTADAVTRDALLERAIAEFEQSRLRDPQMVLAYVDAAIAQTILGRFDEAESGFATFLKERPDDPLPYLFLAVLHYRQAKEDPSHLPDALDNLDKADAAIAKSGTTDRTIEAHVKFYRGLVQLEQNEPEAARQSLQEAQEVAPESDVAKQSQEILEQIEDPRPWDLTLRIGYEYDTNVTLRGDHVRKFRGEDDRYDSRFGLGSAFTYRFIENDNFVLGAGVNTFNTWHTSAETFNVQNYGTNVFAAYSPPDLEWLILSLRYDWDYTFVGNDSFLARHRLTTQVDISETDWTTTSVFYQFDNRNYHDQSRDWRFDRDGDTHVVGIYQYFELAKMYNRPLTASLGYRFENVQTDGTQFSADNNIFSVGVGVPLPYDLTFDVINEFEVDFYKNRNVLDFGRTKRRDFIYTLVLGLTKKFNDHFSARLQMDYTHDDSNVEDLRGQEFFEYDRFIYGLTFIYQF